ncbi:CAAX farnesyltransferase (FTase) subunit beta [Tulasnella sp. 419]|nr:CAAX farnesyltransferase (FTase) subunit beta [Tulasnella sp. 419]
MSKRTVAAPKPQTDDGWPTDSSKSQADTERVISELFKIATAQDGLLNLNRNVHLNWLVRLLFQGFPARYVSQDASQPWLLYFVLQSFQSLGVAFDPDTKMKAISTILAKQHPDGGFGGGPGQLPHILPTYASVCSLAIVGHPGEGGGWDQIDRQKMYRFFMSMKQTDGSFLVNQDAEVDIRGIYCLLVVATLLDIVTPELVHNTFDFVRSCQTYEGGFSASSQPYFAPDSRIIPDIRPALGEAHGGYTSCAVAALMLLKPLVPPFHYPGINGQALLRWAAMMQGSEFSEGGGFRGRTNKLVDGCYKALQQYILIAAQAKTGGLRDKPTAPADAYHTLYNLSGLASAQHRVYLSRKNIDNVRSRWMDSETFIPTDSAGRASSSETEAERQARRRETYVAAHAWQEDESASQYVGGKANRVVCTEFK